MFVITADAQSLVFALTTILSYDSNHAITENGAFLYKSITGSCPEECAKNCNSHEDCVSGISFCASEELSCAPCFGVEGGLECYPEDSITDECLTPCSIPTVEQQNAAAECCAGRSPDMPGGEKGGGWMVNTPVTSASHEVAVLGTVQCLSDLSLDDSITHGGGGKNGQRPQSRADSSKGLKWSTAHLNKKFFCGCQPIHGEMQLDEVEFDDSVRAVIARLFLFGLSIPTLSFLF